MGDYKFTTYRETYNQLEAIGRGLLSIGAKPGDKVIIFSETRAEWLLTAFGAFRHGLTVVTLYSTLGDDAVKHGINESQTSIIITSYELLSKLDVDYIFCFSTMCSEFHSLENIGSNRKNSSSDLFSFAD